MAQYRRQLPQLGGDLYLTDGGIETTLIFHEGWQLADFAAFLLLKTPSPVAEGGRFTENFHSLQISPTASNIRGCTT